MFSAVKEAAVQRRHNLYRDSIVLTNSDPNLHLLGENPPIDWAEEFGGGQEEEDEGNAGDPEAQKRRRMKQVVSMIQLEGTASVLPNESCLEVPAVDNIPEEETEVHSDASLSQKSEKHMPNGTNEDVSRNAVEEKPPTNGSTLKEEEGTTEKSLQDTESKSAIDCAIQEIANAVQEEEHGLRTQKAAESPSSKEETAAEEVDSATNCQEGARLNQAVTNKGTPSSTEEKPLDSPVTEVEVMTASDQQENHITASTQASHMEKLISPSQHADSGFQSPTNEAAGEGHQTGEEECNDSETGEDTGKGESAHMDHQ